MSFLRRKEATPKLSLIITDSEMKNVIDVFDIGEEEVKEVKIDAVQITDEELKVTKKEIKIEKIELTDEEIKKEKAKVDAEKDLASKIIHETNIADEAAKVVVAEEKRQVDINKSVTSRFK